jgi:hypothetical protein
MFRLSASDIPFCSVSQKNPISLPYNKFFAMVRFKPYLPPLNGGGVARTRACMIVQQMLAVDSCVFFVARA